MNAGSLNRTYPVSITRLTIALALTFIVHQSQAQRPDSVTAAANDKFVISSGRHFWMGKNFRKEWVTPVKAPVINLATEEGGLIPKEKGGGKQTRTLKLEDKKGRKFSLRSVEKFITVRTLPFDFESEFAVDLVDDGVSASYPYANLIVPVLADAAGIPHSVSKLVFVPDDPALGEFRKEYGNMLAFLEKRVPDSVSKDYNTDEVVEDLRDDNDNEVDQYALLKTRILDMYVMDFDRHEDQWEWGRYDKEKGKVYYPIARDKDQALYTNEGLLPWIASWPWHLAQLEGFDAEARNLNRFNWAARNLDRFFLTELDESAWSRAVDEFLAAMTDDVIMKAMHTQPDEIKDERWGELVQKLKDRRKFLKEEVMGYYRFLSEDVNITGSDKHEQFEVTLNDDGSADLKIYKITKEKEKSDLLFHRLFDGAVTKELRLYGFGGDDRFIVTGREDKIKIRMIGGEGKDEFINTTNSGETGIVYDMESEGNVVQGEFKNRMRDDTLAHQYNRLGYRYNNAIPFLSVAYNPDDGLYLGVSLKLFRYGFRKEPYKNMHEFAINHALATKALNFRYYAEFISTFGRFTDLLVDADIKAPNNTTNFFGYGTSSLYDKSKPGQFRFYRARYDLGDFTVTLRKNFSKRVKLTLGPTFQFFSLDSSGNKNRAIVQTSINGLDPSRLYATQTYLGGKLTLNMDFRDNPYIPRKGVQWLNTVRYLSGLSEKSYDNLTQVNSEVDFHLSLIPKWVVLSNRFGGGHNFGDFEFYQAQYLGSEEHLRGYRRNRFAGRSKIFNNTDLRVRLVNFKTYLFTGSLGVLGFYDTGKIFADNDTSDKWLSGYGGGVWVAPFRRFVFSFMYAMSEEDKLPLVRVGWQF